MKKWIHHIGILLMVALLSLEVTSVSVKANEKQEDSYQIIDYLSSGVEEAFGSFTTYEEARAMYDTILTEKENPAILYQGKVIAVRYGVVRFLSSETCDVNVEYTNADTREDGYLNGCYSAEGIYLDTYEDGKQVKFQVAGVRGWTYLEDVELIPLSKVKTTSRYRVSKGNLYHDLAISPTKKGYSASILLDEAPDFMEKDQSYLSYDGNFFYKTDEMEMLIDDARIGEMTHAFHETPYFNYYQYVSHRNASVYSAKEIDDYLKAHRGTYHAPTSFVDDDGDGIHDVLTESLLAKSGTAFIQYQNLYGSNALMMLALSMNESAIGRSKLGYLKNNLFGHEAYDNNAEESASRYYNIHESILTHAKNYVSNNYLNPSEFTYHGGYFGNKQSGMNVSYASDPYWGEKAASYYYRMDKALGMKEKKANALGIVSMAAGIPVYDSMKEEHTVLYEVDHLRNYSFLLVGEAKTKKQEYYLVQCDPLLKPNQQDYYRFEDHIGYVKKEDIDFVVNPSALKKDVTYERITFDAGKGKFENGAKKLSMDVRSGDLPAVVEPTRKGYLFIKWDKKISKATKKKTYTAVYTKIKDVKWNKPKQQYGYGDLLDVSDCVVRFEGKDGTKKKVEVTSDMISGYDMEKLGKQKVTLNALGNTYTYTIEVTENRAKTTKRETLQEIDAVIGAYTRHYLPFTKNDKNRIQNAWDHYLKYQPNPSMWEIREFEKIVAKQNDETVIRLHADDKRIGISGAMLAFPSKKEAREIDINIQNDVSSKEKLLLKSIAKNNGFTPVSYYHMEIAEKEPIQTLDVPVVVSIPKPEDAKKNDYYLVYAYLDGEVVRLKTTQTKNFVTFQTRNIGSYAVVKQSVASIENPKDVKEFTVMNEEPSYVLFYIVGGIVSVVVVLISVLLLRYMKVKKYQKTRHKK